MYYISISEENENKLTYYCRNCGHRDENTENFCGAKSENTDGEQLYNYFINEYTKYDPTLPRIQKDCINPDCKTKITKHPAEIIYMRYDDAHLRYVYLCVECNTCWKTDS
jgi:hypothetical protein